jgi:hypothetical protein
MITTNFKIARRDDQTGIEIEYFAPAGVYQFRILGLDENYYWKTICSTEIDESNAVELIAYLELTKKMRSDGTLI